MDLEEKTQKRLDKMANILGCKIHEGTINNMIDIFESKEFAKIVALGFTSIIVMGGGQVKNIKKIVDALSH